MRASSHNILAGVRVENEQRLTYDNFSEEDSMVTLSKLRSLKSLIAQLLRDKMRASALTKTAMAQQLGTSRSGLERLLDPQNTSITLHTLLKAIELTGKKIHICIQT